MFGPQGASPAAPQTIWRFADVESPLSHYVNPEYTLNDLCFWQGRWHLFYQARPPEDPRQHWGHAVSPDLIHWRDLPYAIGPGPERGATPAPPLWRRTG